MHCASCEILIGEKLKKIPGIDGVEVSEKKGEASLHFSAFAPDMKAVEQAIREAGYEIGEKGKLPWISRNPRDYRDLVVAAIILTVIYMLASNIGLLGLNIADPSGAGSFVALLVGLVAGVSTCMALVGGLVLGLSARHAELHPEATGMQKFRPHIYFNIGRIVGYAVMGGIIGLIGSAFRPSPGILGLLTVAVGLVMLFLGLKLIEIFPALRNKSLTLPSGIARLFGLDKEVAEYSRKSSLTAGALTFFLPCGFTQAMQVYAVSTGSFWQGLTVMGLFALGTAPGLLGIGGLSSFIKGNKARLFFMTAGLAVVVLGWTNIANGSRLLGARGSAPISDAVANGPVQEIRITQNANGYVPNVLTVEKGRPVKLIIDSTSAFSCASSIVVPKYGISQGLKPGENVIVFTPTEAGEIPFSCSMGMYRGKIVVTDSVSDAAQDANSVWGKSADASVPTPACGTGVCGWGAAGAKEPSVPDYRPSVEGDALILKSVYTASDYLEPNAFSVKVGQKARLTIDVKDDGVGCGYAIMVPGLVNDPQPLKAGQPVTLEFTPTSSGNYDITCGMRMIRFGTITVE